MTDETDQAVKAAETKAKNTKRSAQAKAASQKQARKPDQWALGVLNGLDSALGTEGRALQPADVTRWLDLYWNASERTREVMHDQELPVMNRVLVYLEVGGYPAVRPCPHYEDTKAEHRFRYGCITRNRWVDIETGPVAMRPLEFTEHALEVLQPRGSLMSFEQLAEDDWIARYISPQMARADLTFEQHTQRARHMTPAMAACTLLLSKR